MTGMPSFVIVLTATAPGLGCSTLTANLGVYLRALAEDLPLAVISLDEAFDPEVFFCLTTTRQRGESAVRSGAESESLLLGQFGVHYLAKAVTVERHARQFRRWLSHLNYGGVLLIDASQANSLRAQAAIQAADLLLVAVPGAENPRELLGVRQTFRAGGANEIFLWLLPSLLQDMQNNAEALNWLRFAADERGLQVVPGEFLPESAVAAITPQVGGSILTRARESRAHEFLYSLAQQIRDLVQTGPDASCRLLRLRQDALLPPRARRVALRCPLCDQLALTGAVHYLESIPQRRRLLIHACCLQLLVAGTGIEPFWQANQPAVLALGREASGEMAELKLWVKTCVGYEVATIEAGDESGWQPLVKLATGKTLREQFPALVVVYPAKDGIQALSARWAAECAKLRHQIRTELAAEFA